MSGGQALFGSSTARGQNKNLVEFKAGKMTMKGKMVHADKRKGLVYIYQSEDSLMHFCWKDRSTGSVEDDLIIFPEDVEFKKVPECTTGRVYLLKFKSSTRKLFFWLQEPKTEKDDENCRKVNDFLNNPPNQRSGGGTSEGDIQNLLSNMSQQQLLQFFGGVGQISGLSSLLGTMGPRSGSGSGSNNATAANSGGSGGGGGGGPAAVASSGGAAASPGPTGAAAAKTPSTPVGQSIPKVTPSAPATKSNSGSNVDASKLVRLGQLQNYLASNFDAQGQPTTASGVDLSTSLNQESLQALLNNPAVVRELQKHLPALGDGNDQESLRATLASPQFQQALSMFSSALQSGQLGPVVSQFEVGADAVSAANQGNMEEFVRALQAAKISSSSANSPSGGGSGSGNQEGGGGNEDEPSQEEKKVKRETEDEDMNLD